MLAGYRAEIAKLDAEEKQVTRELPTLAQASGTTLNELCGVSTVSVAELLVEVVDPRRFTGRLRALQRHRPAGGLDSRRARGPGSPPLQPPVATVA